MHLGLPRSHSGIQPLLCMYVQATTFCEKDERWCWTSTTLAIHTESVNFLTSHSNMRDIQVVSSRDCPVSRRFPKTPRRLSGKVSRPPSGLLACVKDCLPATATCVWKVSSVVVRKALQHIRILQAACPCMTRHALLGCEWTCIFPFTVFSVGWPPPRLGLSQWWAGETEGGSSKLAAKRFKLTIAVVRRCIFRSPFFRRYGRLPGCIYLKRHVASSGASVARRLSILGSVTLAVTSIYFSRWDGIDRKTDTR